MTAISQRVARRLPRLFLGLLLLTGCSPGDADDRRDRDGSEAGRRTAQRISTRLVSMSPIASALLVELDMAEQILAIDEGSARLPALAAHPRLPDVEDDAVAAIRRLRVDLALVPGSRRRSIERLREADLEVLEIAVHDFDDGFALWRTLGNRFERGAEAHARILEVSRPLATLSVESFGRPRPRIAAIASLEPLALEGDHTFVGGLIEIAGGENVVHGQSERSLPTDRAALQALGPALLVRAMPRPPTEIECEAFQRALGDIAPILFVRFDPIEFFQASTTVAARRIRQRVDALGQDPAAPESSASTSHDPGTQHEGGRARGGCSRISPR